VLDASWTCAAIRRAVEALDRRTHSDLVPLECNVPAETARTRIATRTRMASDASAAIAELMAAGSDPWPAAATIRTDTTPGEALELAAEEWRATPRSADLC